MNRDDIIRFGEQADEIADRKIKMRGEYHPDWHAVRDEAFAALVAAAEREECARLVEEIPYPQPRVAGQQLRGHDYLAAAIRARENA